MSIIIVAITYSFNTIFDKYTLFSNKQTIDTRNVGNLKLTIDFFKILILYKLCLVFYDSFLVLNE